MNDQQFDVVVIGGGIHGVGVAQAAAAAGYSVALLEQQELASGTSSRSSKLIHGGLRYLEGGDVSLVRESLRERELLLSLAPDLVERRQFFIPVYKHTSRNRWLLFAGLSLYTILAGFNRRTRFTRVKKSHWNKLDGLKINDLIEVFQYTDAQTDDAALTRAVMKSAQSLGAELLCPAEFKKAKILKGHCEIEYSEAGQNRQASANVLVNAGGPWVRDIAQRCDPVMPMIEVENVQGTHLELLGQVAQGCYYLEVPKDRRAVFVMPWKSDRTLLGTTENVYDGNPAEVKPLDQEIDYLLEVFSHYFPQRSTEVLDSWSGLRVLPVSSSKAFKRSRETRLPIDSEQTPRVVSIVGGKLTGYRATAEKVMDLLKRSLPKRVPRGDTKHLKLTA